MGLGLHFSAALMEAQQPPPVFSPAELASQFRQIESTLNANPPLRPRSLPDQWNVVTSEGRYSIAAQPLRALLGAGRISAARQWVDHIASQLESYSKAPPESAESARQRLNTILARREFSNVHPPTAWDLFRERIGAWVASQFQRLLGLFGQYRAGGRVLFWVLIAAAIGFVAMLLIRLGTRDPASLALEHPAPQAAARNWEAWLQEARRAASAGQWREAIHGAYWAAIARLQENRSLPQDRTRTPREYLRLIAPEQPASSSLRALTLGLERFWYAQQTATAGDFEASLRHLDSLGCRID